MSVQTPTRTLNDLDMLYDLDKDVKVASSLYMGLAVKASDPKLRDKFQELARSAYMFHGKVADFVRKLGGTP